MFLEILVILYVIWEFIVKELREVRFFQSVIQCLQLYMARYNLRNYFVDYWNYYEIFTIMIFIVLIGLRIAVTAGFASLNWTPSPDQYVNFQ